ncbi:MAG: hypothetical protein AAGJ12_10455, partial [Bacteroidota bacterium]
MKKYFFPAILLATMWSCTEDDFSGATDDDPTVDPPEATASVVINEVAYLEGSLELYNNGDISVDLSDYFLCLGPGTYRRIADLPTDGEINLPPNEFLVIDYDMPNAIGGLGLYANNSDFTDPATIRDFVQWGEGGTARENVAVAAGIWT